MLKFYPLSLIPEGFFQAYRCQTRPKERGTLPVSPSLLDTRYIFLPEKEGFTGIVKVKERQNLDSCS